MFIAVPAASASQALDILSGLGETAWVLEEIQLADGEQQVIIADKTSGCADLG